MKLVVGLGNPGKEYEQTRHNVGFMAINLMRNRLSLDTGKKKFHARVIEARIGFEKVLLMKPQTYMNRSGQSVAEAARFYKVEPEDILVIVDETALPTGKLRLRPKGSSGGHNGLKDITRALGTDAWPRLRVGIGEPKIGEHRIPQADYVLGRFTEADFQLIEPALKNTCDAVETWVNEGLDIAMNRFNSKDEGKKKKKSPKPEKTDESKSLNEDSDKASETC